MRLQSFISSVAALVVGAVSVHTSSLQDSLGTRQMSKFRSQIQNDTNLRYIANSGICEATPGVTQYSGYIDVGTDMSMVSKIWRDVKLVTLTLPCDSGSGSSRLATPLRLRHLRSGKGITRGVKTRWILVLS